METIGEGVPERQMCLRCEAKRLVALAMLGAVAAAAQPGSITIRQSPGRAVVTDAAGNIYSTADPSKFPPTPGAAQPEPGGGDCVTVGVPFGGTIHQPCIDIFIAK